MFCSICGTNNPDTTGVCAACGRPMAQPDLNSLPAQPDPAAPPPPPTASTTVYGNIGAAAARAPIAPPPIAAAQPQKIINRRIHALNTTRTEFVQAKTDFDSLQGASLNKVGISRQQTGLH